MANKTQAEILAQVFQYVPQVNQSSKTTLMANLLDFVAEDISHRHDFRSLRATSPDTATMSAGAYSVVLTAWTTMGSSSMPFKDILSLHWMTAGTDDYSVIKFIDDKEFHSEEGYYDYASRTRGKPTRYTRVGDTFLFNVPADETILLRAHYQKFHPAFATSTSQHQFAAKDNMLAFMALTYGVLKESKASLSNVEYPQELAQVEKQYEMFIQRLIARDKDISNEEIVFSPGERRPDYGRRGNTNPYV